MQRTNWIQVVLTGAFALSTGVLNASDEPSYSGFLPDGSGGGSRPAATATTSTGTPYRAPQVNGTWGRDANGSWVFQPNQQRQMTSLEAGYAFASGRIKVGEVRDNQGNLAWVQYQYPVSATGTAGDSYNQQHVVEFTPPTIWIPCQPGDVYNQIDGFMNNLQAIDAEIARLQTVMTRSLELHNAGLDQAFHANNYHRARQGLLEWAQLRNQVVAHLGSLRNVR
jgi:hypothetical protein